MKRAAIAIMFLLASFPVFAQIYVGAAIAHVAAQESHDNPTLYLGYAFSKYLAAEVGYIGNGLLAERSLGQSNTPLGGNVFRMESTMEREEAEWLRATARLTLPINEHVSLFGTISAYRVEVENTNVFQTADVLVIGNNTTMLSGSSTTTVKNSTETVPGFGFGGKVHMGESFSLTAGVERVNLKDGMVRDTDHVQITTIGAEWRF